MCIRTIFVLILNCNSKIAFLIEFPSNGRCEESPWDELPAAVVVAAGRRTRRWHGEISRLRTMWLQLAYKTVNHYFSMLSKRKIPSGDILQGTSPGARRAFRKSAKKWDGGLEDGKRREFWLENEVEKIEK